MNYVPIQPEESQMMRTLKDTVTNSFEAASGLVLQGAFIFVILFFLYVLIKNIRILYDRICAVRRIGVLPLNSPEFPGLPDYWLQTVEGLNAEVEQLKVLSSMAASGSSGTTKGSMFILRADDRGPWTVLRGRSETKVFSDLVERAFQPEFQVGSSLFMSSRLVHVSVLVRHHGTVVQRFDARCGKAGIGTVLADLAFMALRAVRTSG